MRDAYHQKVKVNLENKICKTITDLLGNRRGQPLMLGEKNDNEVKSYIKNLRPAEGILNSTIVSAAARGIAELKNKLFLLINEAALIYPAIVHTHY